MRLIGSFLAVSLASVAACSGPAITDSCPSGTTTGSAPTCVISAECVSTHQGVKLDCSAGGGKCVCSLNGVVGKTVDYQDAFCSNASGSTLTVDPGALGAANDACGWNL
jgi:hypothetical protein